MRLFCFLLFVQVLHSQWSVVSGVFHDPSGQPIAGVQIAGEGLSETVFSDATGHFKVLLPEGFQNLELQITHPQYEHAKIPIVVTDRLLIDLGIWQLEPLSDEALELPVVDLLQLEEFLDDGFTSYGSFLQAQRSLFLDVAAFQFGAVFFKLRGLDAAHQSFEFNGFPMQDISRGRTSWNSWSGLNHLTNYTQTTAYGLQADSDGFGGLLGSGRIWLRPSQLREGFRLSQTASNAVYRHRTQWSVVKKLRNNWALATQIGYRWGASGFKEGTPYRSLSMGVFLEKHWNAKHSSVGSGVFTPVFRGRSAPISDEVFQLKGRQYNPYWGFQNGRVRNARIFQQATPFVVFNHYWKPSTTFNHRFSLGYRWGKEGRSRLDFGGSWVDGEAVVGGGQNPDPTYYQKMPSYALKDSLNPDYARAYLSQLNFQTHGQLDWGAIYTANQTTPASVFALTSDQKQLSHFSFQWKMQGEWNRVWTSRVLVNMQWFNHQYYAAIEDLLGGEQWYDLDRFNPELPQAFNDLLTPERPKGVADPIAYHYRLFGLRNRVDLAVNYAKKGWKMAFDIRLQMQRLQREGIFQNGRFPDSSLGEGPENTQQGFGLKWGLERHLSLKTSVWIRGSWRRDLLWADQIFVNPRQRDLALEIDHLPTHQLVSLGIDFRGAKLQAKLTGYGINSVNERNQRFYFADGIAGDHALFIQEFLSQMNIRRAGIEFSGQWQFIPGLRLEGVAAVGRFQFLNPPQLTLATEPSAEAESLGFINGLKASEPTQLKGYYLGGGPQQAYSLALRYEDPRYWWFKCYVNHLQESYISPNPLTRTANFYRDSQGHIFPEYDPDQAHLLLQQEKLPDFWLVNLALGKSWRLGKRYLRLFASINNVLDVAYRSGGFEQGRNANYRNLLEDQSRALPLFGSKYWWGNGTTYFISLNYQWN